MNVYIIPSRGLLKNKIAEETLKTLINGYPKIRVFNSPYVTISDFRNTVDIHSSTTLNILDWKSRYDMEMCLFILSSNNDNDIILFVSDIAYSYALPNDIEESKFMLSIELKGGFNYRYNMA